MIITQKRGHRTEKEQDRRESSANERQREKTINTKNCIRFENFAALHVVFVIF